MRPELASLLRCPGCHGSPLKLHVLSEAAGQLCREGVLVCEACRRWHPISEFVLELLPEELADRESRKSFWERHAERLGALGLEPDPAAPARYEAPAMQSAQRAYFDDVSEREDRFGYRHFMSTPFWRAQDARMFARWLPRIEPGSLVLDVGCGDGRTTFRLAERARVLGFDLSPRQIRRAVERARREGLLERFTFFVGDASSFPLADASVDDVVIDGVLHHLPDPPQALKETARVLREGGHYFGKENNATPLRPLFDWLQRVRPLWFELKGPSQVMASATIERWALEAGLSVTAEPEVFLPPHAFERLDEEQAGRLLDASDRLFRRIPLFRRWGGLLVVEGAKEGRPREPGNR